MVSVKDKKTMQDYIASRLDGSGSPVLSVKGDANLIVLKDNGLVLLVDEAFGKDQFARLFAKAAGVYSSAPAVVFYKDGKTFFRDGAYGEKAGLKGNRYKAKYGLSLKNYTDEQINKMITLRPEELFMTDRKPWLQYYQPASEQLAEGIESFQFKPVTFDYSHIDSNTRFRPDDRDSSRLSMWLKRNHNGALLDLQNGYLVSRAPKLAS
jgi:hypothetical protein